MESAVRYFVPDSRPLPRTLRAKLQARCVELMGFVAAGVATDYADYRHRVGQIAGLNEAIELCEQLEKEQEN